MTNRPLTEEELAEMVRLRQENNELKACKVNSIILDSICDGMFAIDDKWDFTYISPKCESRFFKPASALLGKCIWDEFPAYVGTQVYKYFHDVAINKEFICFETLCKSSRVWYEVRISPGESGIYVIFNNISESKQAELTLFQSDERFSKAFFSSPVAMSITTWKEHIHLNVNRSWINMFGYSQKYAVGKTTSEMGLWVSQDKFKKFQQDLLNKGKIQNFELQYRKKDGGWGTGLASADIITMNGEICRLISIIDITDRKAVEEELKKSRQSTIDILENISDIFLTLDHAGQITYWNNAAEYMFNLKREEVLGRSFRDVFPKYLGAEFYNQYNKVINENRPVTFETADPYTDYWIEARIYPSPDGFAVYFQNITERKMAIQALAQSEEKFSKAFHCNPDLMAISSLKEGLYVDVNDAFVNITGYERPEIIGKTALELGIWAIPEQRDYLVKQIQEQGNLHGFELELKLKSGEIRKFSLSGEVLDIGGKQYLLNASRDITEERRLEKEMARLDRLNLIGEMAASIGHEIRNPLTAIRGFLQMLKMKGKYAEDAMYFEIMIEEVDRANDIICEYLGMAKDKSINLQPRYLDEVVRSLNPIIHADANYQEMNVLLDLHKPPMPLIDEKEIRQLILNMARNGMEAMSPGGILTIGTMVEENEIVLFIKDEGHGLDPELIDKLGTPFLTTKDKGTGLGLAVCYSIAARHNARIDFQTGAGGTTFYVRFPVPVEQVLLF